MEWEAVIGLEVHVQLNTKSKIFSGASTMYGAEPNTQACAIDLGMPGVLPVLNMEVGRMAVKFGLAIEAEIASYSVFDRKNYFYPDLPKGYQISQYDLPFIYDATLDVDGQEIAITRLHLEEDTGKSTHPTGENYSLIDFNRTGTPLIEMVTEPVIRDAATAKKFCQKYQQILRYLNISDADMENGEMRCEVNISLQTPGAWIYEDGQIKATGDRPLNAKAEIKNINSFKSVEKAIAYEIERQSKILDQGGKILPETRGFSDSQNITISQRVKETAADYRYFPEPDIPPIEISPELIEEIRGRLVELPNAKATRFAREYQIKPNFAEILVADKKLADWFENAVSELRAWIETSGDNWERQGQKLAQTTANWIISELLKYEQKTWPTAAHFAELVTLIYQEKINSTAGQLILKNMIATKSEPTVLMRSLNLEQTDDQAELEKVATKIIERNFEQADQYKKGKTALLQFFVGQVMAETKGKANPTTTAKILKKLLGFTLVELLVAIAIIALIISLSVISFGSVRQQGRNTQRITDIKLIQVALQNYYHDEGRYPTTLISGQPLVGSTSSTTYMAIIPIGPTPADGNCTSTNYIYTANDNNYSYSLSYCLGAATGAEATGPKCATPSGILNATCY